MIYTQGHTPLTRDQLRRIPVPERPNTTQWDGLNHGFLADTVVNRVVKLGFEVANETWFCNPAQTALFGAVDVFTEGTQFEIDLGQPAVYSIGVRHDNMGRYAISLATGARVVVCSNGVFSGDFVIKTKHIKSNDMIELVSEGMDLWLENIGQVDKFCKMMRDTPIDDKDASYLVVRASEFIPHNDHNFMNWSYLQGVMTNWYSPPHEEFKDRTLWSLYNAFTESGKAMTPPRQLKMLKGLKKMMTDYNEKGYLEPSKEI
jgi:hypothetical protein